MDILSTNGKLKEELDKKFLKEQSLYKQGYGENVRLHQKQEFEKYIDVYMATSSKHMNLIKDNYQRKLKKDKSLEKIQRNLKEIEITASLDKKTLHNDYIKSHKTTKKADIPFQLNSFQKNPKILDTNQSILKLADLLDEKKQRKNPKSPDIVIDDDFFKNNEESSGGEFVKKTEIFNEDNEKSRNFLPSIQNLSAISHNLSEMNRKNSKKTKKKPLYELNRKENLLQNELKLLNREKKDYIKQIEKKHHIKMVMIKSNDLLKRNYQNLYDEPYQIEVIDEEDLENSLDNINYFLNKKNNTPNKSKEKGPHLYIFPHVNNNYRQFTKKNIINNNETSINRSNLKKNNENLVKNSENQIKNSHKIDLLESKMNCEIIKEEFESLFIEKPPIIKRIHDNYQKSYNDLVSYRRNMKEKGILQQKRVKSQLDKRKKTKEKKMLFQKEIIGNEFFEDISRITQNQGKINIINDEKFKKVLREIVDLHEK